MIGYVDTKHDPPQVLTVVAITCRQCQGREHYHTEADSLVHCHICEQGYEKVLVPAAELQRLCTRHYNHPSRLHRAVVALAERDNVRLPILTHLTANLPVHLLPTKKRLPLK